MVRAGPMRHRIQIEQRSVLQDAAGQTVETWNLFASPRAALERMPGKEVFASAERAARIPVVFRIRWIPGVTEAMRLIHDGKVHDIVSAVDQAGLREELIITAEQHPQEPA